METYYLKAIEENNLDAIYDLGKYYEIKKSLFLKEQKTLQASDKGDLKY